jgi:pSer/pThr/pTyr-binding forkhead associated (FHA) protein
MFHMTNDVVLDDAQALANALQRDETGERGKPVESHYYFLDIITASGEQKRVPLFTDEILIGRSNRRCSIVLLDERVSRVHLRVERQEDQVRLIDLHSANGTSLDGRVVQSGMPITWLVNQTALIGRTRITLRYGRVDPA